MSPLLGPALGWGRTEVARVLGSAVEVVLRPLETMGAALGVGAGVADGAGVGTTAAEEAASTTALDDATAAAEDAGAGTAEEAGFDAADEAGFGVPLPAAGEPEIVPKVRSWGSTDVPDAINSGPGIG